MNRRTWHVVAQLLVFLATPLPSLAQMDCGKKVRVSEDKFTRKTSMSTGTFTIYRPVGKHILGLLGGADKSYDYNLGATFLSTEDGIPALTFNHTAANAYSSEIATVLLRLADETLVTFSNGVSPDAVHDEHSDYETTFTVFRLSAENLQFLKQANIRMLRIAFGSSIRDFEKTLDDKASAEFRNLALCFSQKIQTSAGQDTARQPVPQSTVTIDQVIQMVTAKLPDDVIVATIAKSGSRFDLTPETLIRLKNAGVSDAVVRAMVK